MPKIIENVREILIAEARKQIAENGYSSVTVRSIAGACGLGVGTVYNYFKSKDMLVATYMLEDWQQILENIRSCCTKADRPEVILECIYTELNRYLTDHREMFADSEAIKVFASVFTERHKQLRSQLAEPIYQFCIAEGKENAGFLAEFVSEALLTWTVAGKKQEEIAEILLKLFK